MGRVDGERGVLGWFWRSLRIGAVHRTVDDESSLHPLPSLLHIHAVARLAEEDTPRDLVDPINDVRRAGRLVLLQDSGKGTVWNQDVFARKGSLPEPKDEPALALHFCHVSPT